MTVAYVIDGSNHEVCQSLIMISESHIKSLLDNSEITTKKFGDKTTVVHCILPNGFVLVESSSCVLSDEYDHSLGQSLAIERIKEKVWMLEGYLNQQRLFENSCKDEDDLPF